MNTDALARPVHTLVGRRIIEAYLCQREGYDDVDLLVLKFDDGTSANIVATHDGEYAGNSVDEYPNFVSVTFNPPDNGEKS